MLPVTCQPGNHLRETLPSHAASVLQSEGPGSDYQHSGSQRGGRKAGREAGEARWLGLGQQAKDSDVGVSEPQSEPRA